MQGIELIDRRVSAHLAAAQHTHMNTPLRHNTKGTQTTQGRQPAPDNAGEQHARRPTIRLRRPSQHLCTPTQFLAIAPARAETTAGGRKLGRVA